MHLETLSSASMVMLARGACSLPSAAGAPQPFLWAFACHSPQEMTDNQALQFPPCGMLSRPIRDTHVRRIVQCSWLHRRGDKKRVMSLCAFPSPSTLRVFNALVPLLGTGEGRPVCTLVVVIRPCGLRHDIILQFG